MELSRGVKPLILSLSMVLKKNTAKSKGMKYGIPALDAVRKFSNEAWLFLAKPLDFLHLCMGGDIHKINTNLILLTSPGNYLDFFLELQINLHKIPLEFLELLWNSWNCDGILEFQRKIRGGNN
jgi:hypothetical protein